MRPLLFLFIPLLSFGQVHPFDARLSDYAYPFPVHMFRVSAQGKSLEMAYMDIAPGKPNGKTAVLLHGKNFAGNYWERTARELSGEGYRVVIPDQIGFGKSSKPTDVQYSLHWLAANTMALLDSLKIDRPIVIGHSMGGMLATRLALMFPERVEKLLLIDPIGLEDWKTVVPYQSVDAWYENERHQNYATLKAYQEKSYYHGTWKPEYDKWLEIPAGWAAGPDAEVIAKCSALTYDMLYTQPVCYEFPMLKMPVLLLVGSLDRTALGKDRAPASVRDKLGNYPKLGKETAAKIPDCRLVELPGVGHLPQMEDYPDYIAAVKDFLK